MIWATYIVGALVVVLESSAAWGVIGAALMAVALLMHTGVIAP